MAPTPPPRRNGQPPRTWSWRRLLCLLGFHRWRACLCLDCGQNRGQHNWVRCTCEVCGERRDQDHQFQGGKCEICGTQRDPEEILLQKMTEAVAVAESDPKSSEAAKIAGEGVKALFSDLKSSDAFFKAQKGVEPFFKGEYRQLKNPRVLDVLARALVVGDNYLTNWACKGLRRLEAVETLGRVLEGLSGNDLSSQILRDLLLCSDQARVAAVVIGLLARRPDFMIFHLHCDHKFRSEEVAAALWATVCRPDQVELDMLKNAFAAVAMVCPHWPTLPCVRASASLWLAVLRYPAGDYRTHLAMTILGELGNEVGAARVAEIVEKQEPGLSTTALGCLCKHWPMAARPVVTSLLTSKATPGELWDHAVGWLPDVFKGATDAVDPCVVDIVIEFATRPTGNVLTATPEQAAIEALGRLGNRRAVEPLLRLRRRDKVPHYLREAAFNALVALGVPKDEIYVAGK